MKNLLLTLLILLLTIPTIKAQDEPNPITTAAPFLLIVPDARAGGMGDVGVATSADANSQHHNPAKYAFLNSQFAVGVNYTPWMRELVNDVFLGGFSVGNRLNDRSAWAASLKYFTLGEIELRETGDPNETVIIEKPSEMSIDGTYALKLNETFAMGVTLRYIRSDFALRVANSELKTVNTFGVDISGYFQSEENNYGDFNGKWRGGFNFSNIGPKVSYVDGGRENFIPTNLKLGGGFDFILDDYNTISTTLEFTKLLVPTPPLRDPITGEIIEGKDDEVGFFKGMFQSFGDAPGGFSEEMKEFTWALGVEYMYDNAFAIRTGYFNENDLKGGRKYFTLGAGFKFKSSNIDISYLFNSSDVNNPLENTLRFSLAFDFGDLYEDY
ncbi:MAG: type IX secretion system outer membrane channel protein PorV [Flavobacteriaceae bacterium]|nr:type IX secretion system outer membrane channel protein PorV [Flavobacteriaceae bacterium]